MGLFSRIFSKRMDFMNLGYVTNEFQLPFDLKEKDLEPSRLRQISLYLKLLEGTPLYSESSLEVGSGFGGGCCLMHEYFKVKNVLGVDKIKSSVNISNDKYKKNNELTFRQLTSDNIHKLNTHFDIIYSLEASQHFSNWQTFYENIAKLLKPNGMFFYADIFDARDLGVVGKLITQAGLVIRSKEDLSSGVLNSIRQMPPLTGFYGWCESIVLNSNGVDFSNGSNFYNQLASGNFRYIKYVIAKSS